MPLEINAKIAQEKNDTKKSLKLTFGAVLGSLWEGFGTVLGLLGVLLGAPGALLGCS